MDVPRQPRDRSKQLAHQRWRIDNVSQRVWLRVGQVAVVHHLSQDLDDGVVVVFELGGDEGRREVVDQDIHDPVQKLEHQQRLRLGHHRCKKGKIIVLDVVEQGRRRGGGNVNELWWGSGIVEVVGQQRLDTDRLAPPPVLEHKTVRGRVKHIQSLDGGHGETAVCWRCWRC